VNLGCMFGFLKEENGQVIVANRIFEMYMLNLLWQKRLLKVMYSGKGKTIKISL